MSGISGILSLAGSNAFSARSLIEMNRLISHRGADDEAFCVLDSYDKTLKVYAGAGSCSSEIKTLPDDLQLKMGLGIRHLKSSAASADRINPCLDPDAGFCIALDGGIYNSEELCRELELEGEISDAALVLAAYRTWGEDCLHRFNGAWSLAIWDAHRQRLFCARDRFGLRPFYYLVQDGFFYFGSEIKQLLPFLRDRQLNLSQMHRMIKVNSMLNYKDETLWSQIKILQPAEMLWLQNYSLQKRFYYRLEPEAFESSKLGFDDAMQGYLELFTDSIRLRQKYHHNPASSLSGGLDSSAIFSVQASEAPAPIHAFSAFFEDAPQLDERAWIRLVLERYHGIGHLISPTADEAWLLLNKGTWHSDLPLGSGCPAQAAIMQAAAKHGFTSIMGGQGADELFGGYRHAQYRFMADQLRQGKLYSLSKAIAVHAREKTPLQLTSVLAKTALCAIFPESRIYALERKNLRFEPFNPYFLQAAGKSSMEQIQDLGSGRLNSFLINMVYSTSLQSLLHYEDRMSMAFGIQSIAPFLDHRLVEFAFSLPASSKIAPPQGKYLHRRAIASLVPEEIIQRKYKSVFGTPLLSHWMRGALKENIYSVIYSKDFRQRGIWNLPLIHQHWQSYLRGSNRQAEMLFNILSLELWLRTFVKNDEII